MRHLLITIIAISFAACGEGLIDTTEVLDGDINSQNDPLIQKTLKAVDKGLVDGDQFMTLKVNEVLEGFNIKYFYHGMTTLTHEADVMTPTGGEPGCPYVGATVTGGFDSGPQSCRFLADKSLEAADLAKDQIDPNQAIDESFSQNDGNLLHYRAWYMNGANNSIEMTAVLLSGTLRQAAVCDNAPSPKESAFQRGVALGKKLYIQAMNERLKQVGIDFTYPDGQKPTKSIRYCQANLRDPAMADAKARVASALAQEPLCSAIGSDPIEQSSYYQQYKEVEKEYQAGVYSGMMSENTIAQGVLKGAGCCIASPLVLDLAGDGLNMGGKVNFDLLGNGVRVETSWIRGDDALLVLDANENGRIDSGNELFGNTDEHASGFDNLATHDANSDGVIDASDPIYSQLRLWQDNGDGVSSAGELSTLPQMGVKAIELSYTEGARVDLHGNQLRQTARFIRTAEFARALGAAGTVVDVWFNYN
jgi:hypothetical protein